MSADDKLWRIAANYPGMWCTAVDKKNKVATLVSWGALTHAQRAQVIAQNRPMFELLARAEELADNAEGP